jgi:hypothetical protein
LKYNVIFDACELLLIAQDQKQYSMMLRILGYIFCDPQIKINADIYLQSAWNGFIEKSLVLKLTF